jgi:hypothetical protein
MRARFSVLSVIVLAALGVAPAALAHDHVPPQPTLHAAGQREDPGFVEIQWIWRDSPQTCIQANFIGTGTFGDRGRRIVAPFGTDHAEIHVNDVVNPPVHVELYSWPKTDRRGAPAGARRDHDVTLVPRVVRGEVIGWSIEFAPHRRGPGYYQLFAVWPDDEGCGGDQFGIWRYRLDVANP